MHHSTADKIIYSNATTAIHMLGPLGFTQYQTHQILTSEHPWHPRLGADPGEGGVAVREHKEDNGQPEGRDSLPRAH